jgi:type IV pilus assembly protein PilM
MLSELFDLGRTHAIGLDVGTFAVKMMQLTRDGSGLTMSAAAIENTNARTDDNEPTRKAKTVDAIRRCYKHLNSRTKYVVCGVSGPEVAARSFNLPTVAAERLEGAVMAEAADVCPFNIRQNCFDYQLVGAGSQSSSGKTMLAGTTGGSGIMVAATNVVVNDRRQMVEAAGLNCALMDVNGLAMTNLFNECEKAPADRSVVLLNVGNNSANMVIMGDKLLPFVRDFGHGGQDIVTSIARERGMTAEAVRKVLNKEECTPDMQLSVSQGMKTACIRLSRDIAETLRYHMTQEKSGPVDAVYVCGGFALADGFVAAISSLLNLQGRLWNPFVRIPPAVNSKGLDVLETKGPAFIVAAGLAMRSI